MQTPYRKPGKYSQIKPDPLLTKGKIVELENKLEKLKKKRPEAADEVRRLSDIITPQKQTNTVQVGHHVTIETDNRPAPNAERNPNFF